MHCANASTRPVDVLGSQDQYRSGSWSYAGPSSHPRISHPWHQPQKADASQFVTLVPEQKIIRPRLVWLSANTCRHCSGDHLYNDLLPAAAATLLILTDFPKFSTFHPNSYIDEHILVSRLSSLVSRFSVTSSTSSPDMFA